MTELEPRPGEELERQLGRYARLRLDPSPGQTKRARSAIMEAAWRQKLQGPAVAAPSDTEPSVVGASMTVPSAPGRATSPDRGLFGGWGGRRLGVSLAAAVLVGVTLGSSVFAASRAGGPLYEPRLAVEELTLPSDAQARVEAELAQAQGRLAEIVDSAAKDDQGAVLASVAAYVGTLDDLQELPGGLAGRALVAIQQHQAVLERVLGQVPEQARSGIENALVMSGKVIDRLSAVATPAPVSGPDSGTGAGGANGNGGGANAGGGHPTAGPGANNANGGNPNTGPGANDGNGGGKPAGTPKPAATPKADRTPRPVATPKPERTPKPARTPTPPSDDRPTPKSPQGGRP